MLFFFSSFAWTDAVEFQMSFDRRTGKPIAVSVIKLEHGSVSFELLSENQVTGTVAAEAKALPKGKPVRSHFYCSGSTYLLTPTGISFTYSYRYKFHF